MLMAVSACERSGFVHIDVAAVMLAMTGEAAELGVEGHQFFPRQQTLPGIVYVEAGMLVVIDEIGGVMAGQATGVGRAMPWLMTCGTFPIQLLVRRHQRTGLVTGAPPQQRRRQDERQ